MVPHANSKSELILEAIRNSIDSPVAFFQIYKNPKGTRFTKLGYELARSLWDVYTIKLPSQYVVLPRTLIKLDELMEWPYFLNKTKLVLFNEMDAFEFALYQGDLNKWSNK